LFVALAVATALASLASVPVVDAASTPSAPQNFTAKAGDGQAYLSWTAPSYNGGSSITGYNIFRNGTFLRSVGIVSSSTVTSLTNGTTYRFSVSAFNSVGGGTHTADISVTPTSGGTTVTTGGFTDRPGWDLRFSDEFSTNIARGSFVNATKGRYYAYPNTWRDTSGNGTYSPEIIAVQNGVLDMAVGTVNGVHKVAAFRPLPAGMLSSLGDLKGLRAEFRIRADRMLGYKGVPLLWPMSGKWPYDGEINFPESNFDINPRAYMHHQAATSGSDQEYFFTPSATSWQDWHTYVIEWKPGVSCEFFLDGKSIGRSTYKVPSTAMHLDMQFETQVSGGAPSSTVSGHIQIDRLAVWAMN